MKIPPVAPSNQTEVAKAELAIELIANTSLAEKLASAQQAEAAAIAKAEAGELKASEAKLAAQAMLERGGDVDELAFKHKRAQAGAELKREGANAATAARKNAERLKLDSDGKIADLATRRDHLIAADLARDSGVVLLRATDYLSACAAEIAMLTKSKANASAFELAVSKAPARLSHSVSRLSEALSRIVLAGSAEASALAQEILEPVSLPDAPVTAPRKTLVQFALEHSEAAFPARVGPKSLADVLAPKS